MDWRDPRRWELEKEIRDWKLDLETNPANSKAEKKEILKIIEDLKLKLEN